MDSQELPLTIVDAFTRHPGAGNRAGVMLDAPPLDAEEMMAIARAVSASETAFLLPPSAGADFAMRYFSPAAEVDFCGHATVAAFHLLAETGRVQVPGRYVFDCPAGRLDQYGEVMEQSPTQIKLKVKRERVILVCKALLDELPVTDIDIQEVPIEDVIRQIFARG